VLELCCFGCWVFAVAGLIGHVCIVFNLFHGSKHDFEMRGKGSFLLWSFVQIAVLGFVRKKSGAGD